MKFTRITINPNQMGGVPCIRRLRIPVATAVGMIAEGMTEEEILRAYPDLEREDIHKALLSFLLWDKRKELWEKSYRVQV